MAKSCVDQIIKLFHISNESLHEIKGHLAKEFELGLRDEESATIKMLITYVRELSRGDETGSYLALDLGGTHFRVLLVTLTEGEATVTSVVHDIPASLLTTTNGSELFDYIALKLLEFVQQYKLERRRISLGFTFSFPCKQYGLTQSVLVKWCKGFNVSGVIGTDVVKQLKNALKRQLAGLVGAYIDVVAVINDTTGTLVACANKNRDCRIGLIVGTGFNACYMERLERCEKWPSNYTYPKEVIINCEWGALGDNKDQRELDKFRNEFDLSVDDESVNPRSQTYEKMVSGMYLGELLRLVLSRVYYSKVLFASNTEDSIGTVQNTESEQPKSHSGRKNKVSNSKMKQTVIKSKSPKAPLEAISSKESCALASKSPSPSSTSNPDLTTALSHKLHIKDILNGRHLSMLAKDEIAGSFEESIKVMKELNISTYNQEDLKGLIRIGNAIITRSAHLVAAGISALLERMQRPYTVIGYDGSVIRHHPYFLQLVNEKTQQLTPKQFKFKFIQSSDGSGIGAAVVAAALHRERRPLYVLKPGRLYEMHFSRNPQW